MTRPTRSRTSLAAASTSRSGLNSMLIVEWPSREFERIVSMPSRPAIRSSMTCVILFSTISRACAQVVGRDRHEHRVDLGIFAHGEAGQRHEAQDHQQQADDRREDRPPDREFRELHRAGPLVRGSRGAIQLVHDAAVRIICVPSMTTRSPAASPLVISTSPGLRRPIATSRRSHFPVRDDEHVDMATLGHHGLFGHDETRQRIAADLARSGTCRAAAVPSRFGSLARTLIDRVTGSTRESTDSTAAAERHARVGDAGRARRSRPGFRIAQEGLRHVEVELHRARVIERRDHRARGSRARRR